MDYELDIAGEDVLALMKSFAYDEAYAFLRQNQDFHSLVERLSTIWSESLQICPTRN